MRTTRDKLATFSALKAGWGKPMSPVCTAIVDGLLDGLEKRGVVTDVFPGTGGEIMLTIYSGAFYEEYTFETDGTVIYARERNDTEEAYVEGKSVEWATARLELAEVHG